MGKSKQKSTTAPSYAWTFPGQTEALGDLWGQSQAALPYAASQAQATQRLAQQGVNQQLSPALNQQSLNALGSVMNANYAPQVNVPSGVNPQLGAYQRSVQQNFQNNIMPGINASTMGSGQALGTSRGQIAGQQAALQANQQVADMAANLYGQDMDRMLASQQANQGAWLQNQQIRSQAANMGLTAQQAAMQMAPDVAGMGMKPYEQMAQILGSPTAVSVGGGGTSKGKSFGI